MNTGNDVAKEVVRELTGKEPSARFHPCGEGVEMALFKGAIHVRLTNRGKRGKLTERMGGGGVPDSPTS